ncbi:hypothetical protein PS710_00206 [Pseudomonas fluorescens]|uniref:Uncharacterized protein n=1 Tax=Pseudomonas fluorescens TaxID=294 RepID=A0A5E6ZMQ2_PSEFL|nr:hypothetical protein PS710_00206 [Pseudomonas fluorescens]
MKAVIRQGDTLREHGRGASLISSTPDKLVIL